MCEQDIWGTFVDCRALDQAPNWPCRIRVRQAHTSKNRRLPVRNHEPSVLGYATALH